LNGGLTETNQITHELGAFDGVMIGREAYNNPYFLTELELALFGTPKPNRFDICKKMIPYIESQSSTIHSTTRHMLGLFNGIRGARSFRQVLSTDVHTSTSVRDLMEKALSSL
jgi:tRNA-dihydrouridine synthase A